MPTFVAVDLGATSGRVVSAQVENDSIALDVVHRFATRLREAPAGELWWDFDGLLGEVRVGLERACARGPVASVAVDSWAVDNGLHDGRGDLIGPVHAYRSSRTNGVMEEVVRRAGREQLYRTTGIQFLPFNTINQLFSARESDEYRNATSLLMIPDLVNHALCGSETAEVTNASTTQLLDVTRRAWSDELIAALGLRRDVMPPLHEPGQPLGTVRGMDRSVDGVSVVAAASHDTASAVAGIPLRPDRPAVYISCGTWSLVGCELDHPVTTPEALAANATNELGVAGTVRLLKNVTGLWLLEECRRAWAAVGLETTSEELAARAAHVPGGRSVVDPDDPRFAAPGEMPQRIAEACRESGQPEPASPAEFARTIFDSLALTWRTTVQTIERVAGFDASVVHLVGGGASIPLLRQLCASACERPVLAGPAETTVAGNALVQAIAHGVWDDVASSRVVIESALPSVEVLPETTLDWIALAER